MLSFAGDGFSLGIDIPMPAGGSLALHPFLTDLFELLASLGARIHLAKDSSLSAQRGPDFLMDFEEFVTAKAMIDPDCLFVSDMFKRVFKEC